MNSTGERMKKVCGVIFVLAFWMATCLYKESTREEIMRDKADIKRLQTERFKWEDNWNKTRETLRQEEIINRMQ